VLGKISETRQVNIASRDLADEDNVYIVIVDILAKTLVAYKENIIMDVEIL
jgi:hypothetical protein